MERRSFFRTLGLALTGSTLIPRERFTVDPEVFPQQPPASSGSCTHVEVHCQENESNTPDFMLDKSR